MAHSKSALKHVITDNKRRIRHKAKRSVISTTEKKFRAAVAAGEKELIVTLCSEVCSFLDKAAKTGAIHANKASRKKGQLMAIAHKATC